LNDSASIVSIANSTVVDLSSGKRVQITSMSAFIAQSLIAGSQKSLDSGDSKAIQRRMNASQNRVAGISGASLVVVTRDIAVYTSNLRVASINGAVGEVVTIGGSEGNRVASSGSIAEILCASVIVVAGLSGVDTFSSGSITRVSGASVSIITVNVSLFTGSEVVIAFVNLAVDGSASDVEALVARND